MSTGTVEPTIEQQPVDTAPRSRLVTALVAVIAVAALVIALAGGWFWGNRSGSDASAATPSATSVDAGFARDMSTHHRQAVTMAQYEIAKGSDPQAKLFAYDIDATQSVQLGEMQGWLESWGLSPVSTSPMIWMGAEHAAHVTSTGLMPGMATAAELTRLRSLSGKALDVLFLQLMIRHHQGGVSMAEYAAEHAQVGYVQQLAQKMVDLQTSEITQMEQTLRQLGGSPLSPPDE